MEEDFDDDHHGRLPDRRRPACRALRDGGLRHARRVGAAMGHDEAADLLEETLDEEKAADKKLSGFAEGGINQSAADATHSDEDEEAVAVGGGARKKGATNGKSGARRR